MNVGGVDPRDIEREEKAVYRVYFWSARRTVCHEFELTDAADVHEVLHRIDANADGREVEGPCRDRRRDVGRGAVLGSRGAYLFGPCPVSSVWVYSTSSHDPGSSRVLMRLRSVVDIRLGEF